MKTNKLLPLLCLIMVVAFTGCKKEPQPTQDGKEITIMVKTSGLIERPMTKSFDINTWTYNYNPKQYELKFVSANKTYVFLKNIEELRQGFPVSLVSGNYEITYTSVHTPTTQDRPIDNFLDITIRETKNISSTSDLINLQAKPDDYLIVVQNGSENAYYNHAVDGRKYFFNGNNYKYGYLNIEGDLTIMCISPQQNLTEKTINCVKGNVYHIVTGINGNSNISVLPMNYNIIAW